MSPMVSISATMARSVVEVAPADGKLLRMYPWRPTVYRYAHIGNLRTFVMADLARRAFSYQNVRVLQVQNITDVGHMTDEQADRGEDKILLAAGLEGRPPTEIAAFYTE